MYTPPHFEETRVDLLQDLIRARSFGTLVSCGSGGPEANHLPFIVIPEAGGYGTLQCHVARGNPVWRRVDGAGQVLVIFLGPDAYVSPTWYPGKEATGRAVPTWNYVAVHAYGVARVVEDRQWLRAHLEALTLRHESGRGAPWRLSDAPADYIERMIGGVVGIEIPVSRLLGKCKLSQNRSAADRAGVVEGLCGEGTDAAVALAGLMQSGPG